jgi:micrococcal nuclease
VAVLLLLAAAATAVLPRTLGGHRAAPAPDAQAASRNGGHERVVAVQSGDTFSTAEARPAVTHIVGIDAPEAGECGFDGARRNLRLMIAQRPISLYWDSLQPRRDTDGRRLRYAVLGPASHPWDVGYMAVAAGWARVSLENDFMLVAQYLQAQATAQAERRGVWRCGRGRPR